MNAELYQLSEPRDIFANLAVEATLFETLPPDTLRIFLWRSHEALVLGKNQNPWRECQVQQLVANGVPLARRQSGGGTVYHDGGNLNFSFMLPQAVYQADRIGNWICSALSSLGLDATLGDRHIIEVNGRKCSGNAFCYRRQRVLHHGTLLLNADLDRLRGFLQPTLSDMSTHAVASVSSPVINLREVAPQLTADDIFSAIANVMADAFPHLKELDPHQVNPNMAAELTREYSGADWRLGKTPAFSVSLTVPSSAEPGTLDLRIVGGCIESVSVRGFSAADADILTASLPGTAFSSSAISAAASASEALAKRLLLLSV